MKGPRRKGLPPALSNLPGARFNTAFSFSQTDPDLCQLETLAGDLSRAAIWVAQQNDRNGLAAARVEGLPKRYQDPLFPEHQDGCKSGSDLAQG